MKSQCRFNAAVSLWIESLINHRYYITIEIFLPIQFIFISNPFFFAEPGRASKNLKFEPEPCLVKYRCCMYTGLLLLSAIV